jgi:hypothetical protein
MKGFATVTEEKAYSFGTDAFELGELGLDLINGEGSQVVQA